MTCTGSNPSCAEKSGRLGIQFVSHLFHCRPVFLSCGKRIGGTAVSHGIVRRISRSDERFFHRRIFHHPVFPQDDRHKDKRKNKRRKSHHKTLVLGKPSPITCTDKKNPHEKTSGRENKKAGSSGIFNFPFITGKKNVSCPGGNNFFRHPPGHFFL